MPSRASVSAASWNPISRSRKRPTGARRSRPTRRPEASTSRSSSSTAARRRGEPAGPAMIKALRRAMPQHRHRRAGPARRAARRAEALEAGASAYVAKTSSPEAIRTAVEAAADSGSFIDPAARATVDQGGAHQAPTGDPSAPGRRPLDRRRRPPPSPERRDGAHSHQGHPRTASAPATAPTRSRSPCAPALSSSAAEG